MLGKRLRKMSQGRWEWVHGRIGAVIATLLDMGWTPTKPNTWTDDAGNDWGIDASSSGLSGDLHKVISNSVKIQQ